MTSAVPPPPSQQPASQQQQQQRANLPTPPNPPSTPVAAPIQSAVSPPSKRDLKSWWKGFKIPLKHQESHGTGAPSTIRFPRSKPQRKATIFAEDMHGDLNLLQNIVSEEEQRAVHRASASMSQPPPARPSGAPKLSVLARIVACRFGRSSSPPELRRKSHQVRTKLIVAEHRPQGIFGVPLRQSITYANVAISLVDEDGKSYIYGYVPIVVAKCGVFLKERATEIEGIFRLSGSEKRIKELKHIFDSPDRYGKGLVWDGYTVHDAANVLRRYLNDLPEPVVPLDLYEKFREPLRGATKPGNGDAEGPQFVPNFNMHAAIIRYQQLITELPPLNRQLLLYILDLLAVFAAKSDHNRMTSQNLAAIFQPGMLSHPNHAMAPEEYRLNQCVIIFLIENQDHFLIGMQGTAADEMTVAEVQKGTPIINPPSTPTPKSGIVRSASTASAGAESVAKDGSIRRNKSTASRRSFQSNGCPSPASPAVISTPASGLARSNTLPSKKSPALQSGRFASRNDTHVAPMTPVAPPATTVVSPPDVVQEVVTPPEESAPPISTSTGRSSLQPGLTIPVARSQERLREPPTPEATTPSKERRMPILFQRIASSESDGRQPNKLRKKRLPGSANPSAHSSTASLPHPSAASPNVEVVNPLEAIPSASQTASARGSVAPQPAETPSEPTPRASHAPSNAEPSHTNSGSADLGNAELSSTNTLTSPSNTTEGSTHADTLHPSSAQAALKSKKSPPTSLHSSFNESSDLDQVDEPIAAPAEVAIPDTPSEKETKKRWRLSRKREDAPPPPYPPPASARAVLGSNSTAGGSGTSINSSGKPSQSTTGDMSDRTTINTDSPLVEVSSKESKDDSKKISNWIKNRYREHKEHAEHRRTKSPPGERTVSMGSSFLSSRGKSLDLKRPEEERPAVPQLAQMPQPTQVSEQARMPQATQVPPQAQAPQPTQMSQAAQMPQPAQIPPPAQVSQPAQMVSEPAHATQPQDPKAQ